MRRLIALLTCLLLGVALAQTTDASLAAFDFANWGKSAFTYGGIVAALVALVRPKLPMLTGWQVTALAFVLSEAGAFVLFGAGLLTDPLYTRFTPPWVWLTFGLAGWIVASGGYKLISGFLYAHADAVSALSSVPVAAAPVVITAAPQVLYPANTPGTLPLHDVTGQVIGAVKPLAPTSSGDERLP